jgi:hypothetical protein
LLEESSEFQWWWCTQPHGLPEGDRYTAWIAWHHAREGWIPSWAKTWAGHCDKCGDPTNWHPDCKNCI